MRYPILAAAFLPLVSPALAAAQAAPAPAGNAASPDATPEDGDDYHTPADDIVVTAQLIRSLDLFGNVGIVEGDELAKDLRVQIGDSLARQPGVSATSFTPGASRPVLRGFQGERVRVLVDGIGSIDASNTSADHAVAIDPLTAERIEIVRGPASLLFGSSAIGGAVNIFDRRIPRSIPESPAHVDAIATYGSAADERSGGASVDLPLGDKVVIHADGAYSRTDDLRIGGFQLSPALRQDTLASAGAAYAVDDIASGDALTAVANENRRIPNSATETYSAGIGAALITSGGSLGASVGYFDSTYGIPSRPGSGEDGVSIALKQWRADVRGEVTFGDGFIDRLRIRAAFADYEHAELEDGAVGTTFLNQGIEARAELVQNDRNGWNGASGVQFFFRDFNAIGDEAFVPQNDTEQFALFTLQQVELGAIKLEGSLRYETTDTIARSLGIDRSFSSVSGAIGASHEFGSNSKVGVNIARTARAPSAEELFSNGPHVATQSFEVGNPAFVQERAWSAEAFTKINGAGFDLNLTAYASWFDNFIYADETGVSIDDLPVFQYRQAKARYYGVELEASAPIIQAGGFTLIGDVVADAVRARLANGGGNIPRIPPLRVRGGLELKGDTLDLRGEIEWTDTQKRIADFETATPGFTMVNASAEWKPLGRQGGMSLILSGNNLFDVVGRRAASFTKEFVPLAGRDIRLTARISF